MPELIDLVVDLDRFLDIGIGCRQIGLRLIIIVIADKELDCGIREQFLEFRAELGGKRFIVRKDKRGLLHTLDDFRHSIGFSASRYAEKDLHPLAVRNALTERIDRLRLVTLRLIGRNDCKPVFQCLLLFLFNNCYSITELFQIEDLFFSLLFQVKQPSCFRFFARPGKMVETINRKVRREERFPFFIRPGA